MIENVPMQSAKENPEDVAINNQLGDAAVKEKIPTTDTHAIILGWIFGIGAFFIAAISYRDYQLVSIFIITGAVVFPPFLYLLKKVLNIQLSGILRWLIYIILLFIGFTWIVDGAFRAIGRFL